MTIELYKNLSEPNIVNKNITLLATASGALRDGTSILSPTIRLEYDSTVQAINYVYIVEFERFYFVGDIASVRSGLWDLACHVDVLSTYKNQLYNLSAVIARQEKSYNLYLEDDRLLTTCRRRYSTIAFPNRVTPARGNSDSPSFILTCAGGAEIQQESE